MDWETVKNIQASIDRLKSSKVSEDAKVKMILNGKEAFLHSIAIDGGGNVIIHLDQDEALQEETLQPTEFKKVHVEGEGFCDVKILGKSPKQNFDGEYVYFLEIYHYGSKTFGYPAYTNRQLKNIFNIDVENTGNH